MKIKNLFIKKKPRTKTYLLNTLDEEARKKKEALRKVSCKRPTLEELIRLNQNTRPKKRKPQEQKREEMAEVQLQAPSKGGRLNWLWGVAAAIGATILIFNYIKN